MARTAVRVGIGLYWLLSACGGTSKPPSDKSAGASSGGTSGAGGTGSGPVTGGVTATGGTSSGASGNGAASGTCDGCAGEAPVEQVCEPNAHFCENNRVIACKPDGSGSMLWTDCGTFYHCVEEKEAARCETNTCVPSEVVCDGNVLKTCSKEGTLPTKGKDCGDDVCEAGECKPLICEPSSRFCKDDAIYQCSQTGAQETISFNCDARLTCRDDNGDAECVARLCEPAKSGCIDEVLGTCAEDGLALVGTETDCEAGGDICDLVSGCGSSAIDTLGKRKDVEMFLGGELAMNVLDVRSARKLVEIETNWLLDQPRDVRFVIYELTTDDLFHVRYDEITSTDGGSGFFSSGPIDFPLEAGKRYLIGAGLVVGEGYAYYEGAWTGITSFATTLGGMRTAHADEVGQGLNTASLYVMRLKTAVP